MDKSMLLEELTKSGEISRFSHTTNWGKAFDLYNKSHPRDVKSPRCGHCFKTVLAWLKGEVA